MKFKQYLNEINHDPDLYDASGGAYIGTSTADRGYHDAVTYGRREHTYEPYIMKEPEWAFKYARDVLKRRWTEAEPYIIKNPYYASQYAVYVVKKRWPEAEKSMASSNIAWGDYLVFLIHQEYSEADKLNWLIQSGVTDD